ncbi:hypothetical protein AAHE18_15G151600 [Arachis hypogaea]
MHRTCNLLRKVQVPPVGLFPNCLVQQKVLHPFRKQKWSKGKQKEKVNNQVLFDQGTYDKLLSKAPKFKLITPSILSDCLRKNPSIICLCCPREWTANGPIDKN